MDSKKQLATNSGIYFIINILQRGANFLTLALLARILGPYNFGIFSLGQTVRNLSQNIGLFGFGVTAQREFSGQADVDQRSKVVNYVRINLLFAIIVPLLIILLSPMIANEVFHEPRLETILKYFAVLTGLGVVSNFFISLHRAKRSLNTVFNAQLLDGLFKLILLFVLTQIINLTLELVVYVFIVIAFIQLVFILRKSVKIDAFKSFTVKNLWRQSLPKKQIFQIGVQTTVIGLGYFVNQQVDRIMLGMFENAEVVGKYVAIIALVQVLSVVQNSMVNAFMPIISEFYKSRDFQSIETSYLFLIKITTFINFVFSIVAISFGSTIIKIFFGYQYDDNAINTVLILLVFINFFSSWTGPTGATLLMAGRTKLEFINTSCTIIINIIANFLFLYVIGMGIIGASLATFSGMILINIVQLIQVNKTFSFNPISRYQIYMMILFALFLVTCIVINLTIFLQSTIVILFLFLLILVEWIFLSSADKYYLQQKVFFKLKKVNRK